jgi:hypothetical protein
MKRLVIVVLVGLWFGPPPVLAEDIKLVQVRGPANISKSIAQMKESEERDQGIARLEQRVVHPVAKASASFELYENTFFYRHAYDDTYVFMGQLKYTGGDAGWLTFVKITMDFRNSAGVTLATDWTYIWGFNRTLTSIDSETDTCLSTGTFGWFESYVEVDVSRVDTIYYNIEYRTSSTVRPDADVIISSGPNVGRDYADDVKLTGSLKNAGADHAMFCQIYCVLKDDSSGILDFAFTYVDGSAVGAASTSGLHRNESGPFTMYTFANYYSFQFEQCRTSWDDYGSPVAATPTPTRTPTTPGATPTPTPTRTPTPPGATPTPPSDDEPRSFFIPVLAQTQGVGGSDWRTEVCVTNLENTTTNLLVLLADTETWGATWAVPGNSTACIDDLVVQVTGEDSFAGWGAILIDDDKHSFDRMFVPSVRIFNLTDHGTYGQSVSVETDDNANHFCGLNTVVGVFPGVWNTSAFRTNIGIAGTDTESQRVIIDVLGPDGEVVWHTTRDVAPFGFEQFAVPSGRQVAGGHIEMRSNGLALGFVSVVDNLTGDGLCRSSLPVAQNMLTKSAVSKLRERLQAIVGQARRIRAVPN